MSFVAFPVRLENGFLRRVDEPSAILALIEMMARTPHGSWPGSPHFGLRDYLHVSGAQGDVAKTALDEVNHALADLGIQNYRVESLVRETFPGEDSAAFIVTLKASDGQTQVLRIASRD
jgi:hypothetical protein